MLNQNKNCCYQCTRRTIECHSTCRDYADYKNEREAISSIRLDAFKLNAKSKPYGLSHKKSC